MKNIDWSNLGFGYMKTDYNVRCRYRNGSWGEIEVSSEESLNIHMAATCLHYGQEAFEGLKAFRGKDGKVRIFRLEANAERLQSTCDGILMPQVSTELFREMVTKVVELNKDFIPPYESGASLYIRPLLIGVGAQVGVHPTDEYLFVIFVTPVGPYFKGGFSTNPYVIIREFDRSAPLGTGRYKVGGNYAASLKATSWLTRRATLASSTSMQKRKNISMSVVQPTSSVSKITPMLLPNLLLFCPQSPTAA
jgi:branched-chain amino acid aminotransferase